MQIFLSILNMVNFGYYHLTYITHSLHYVEGSIDTRLVCMQQRVDQYKCQHCFTLPPLSSCFILRYQILTWATFAAICILEKHSVHSQILN